MALTVSPQIRIVALVGLLLAVGFGGALRVMGGGSGSATSVAPSQNSAVLQAKDVAARASARASNPTEAAPAAHKAAASKAVAAKPKVVPAQPKAAKAQPKAVAKPAPTPKMVSQALAAGLPLSIAQALAVSPTVVAAVFNPQAPVDGIAFAEARAGAALAGAGFVGLNVLSRADVGRLTEQLGILPDPAILIFTRPAILSGRIDGFADKETVAQAAHDAASGS
jgi:hypothetical protein